MHRYSIFITSWPLDSIPFSQSHFPFQIPHPHPHPIQESQESHLGVILIHVIHPGKIHTYYRPSSEMVGRHKLIREQGESQVRSINAGQKDASHYSQEKMAKGSQSQDTRWNKVYGFTLELGLKLSKCELSNDQILASASLLQWQWRRLQSYLL